MSATVYKALSKTLLLEDFDQNDLCCLCLRNFDEDCTALEDEVLLGMSPEGPVTEIMKNIVEFLIGGKVSEIMEVFKSLCKCCAELTIKSYKFIQNSKGIISALIGAFDHFENSFQEYCDDDSCNNRSLFVTINPDVQTFSGNALIQKYYDSNSVTKSKALSRLNAIIKNSKKNEKRYGVEQFTAKVCCLSNNPTLFHKTNNCNECGAKILNDAKAVKEHELGHHGDYKCQKCDKTFNQLWYYNKHRMQKNCADPRRGEFICDYCGHCTLYKFAIARHIKFEHKGEKGYVCEWCAKNCYTPSALKAHLRKHTKEKEFVCTDCGGKFVNMYSLKNHMKRHTGELPYPCSDCNRSFRNASTRLEHIRRFHTAPSLECDICHHMFKAKASLLKHKKRHWNSNSKLNKIK